MERWVGPASVAAVLVAAGLLVEGSFSQARRTLAAKSDDLTRAYDVVAGVERHRIGLLPELAGVVHPSTPEEQAALTGVDAGRAAVLSAGSNQAASMRANARLDGALRGLLQVEDARPEQRANAAFEDVASDLVTTERDLSQDRRRYDRTLADYNVYLGQFPNGLWGQMAGFHARKDYFDPGHKAQLSEFEH